MLLSETGQEVRTYNITNFLNNFWQEEGRGGGGQVSKSITYTGAATSLNCFQMIIGKTDTKVITRTDHNRDKLRNKSEFLRITCNVLYAMEKQRIQEATGFRFASHWLKN